MTEHTADLRVTATLKAGLVSLADFVVQGDQSYMCCISLAL